MTGITNEEGQVYQSYCYSVFEKFTLGAPQYENEYTYNGESYNSNIRSKYLRARYYCVASPVNYVDFSGNTYLGILEMHADWLIMRYGKLVPQNPGESY